MHATKEDMKDLDRLQKRSDFLRVGEKPQKWVAKGMIILSAPNDLPIKRIGITVTKRLEKSSVKRNRMKRRLRAAARDVLSKAGKDGTDYVLIARADTATRDYKDLQKDLRWSLEKLGHAPS
jgi:ribonuclease P protein component